MRRGEVLRFESQLTRIVYLLYRLEGVNAEVESGNSNEEPVKDSVKVKDRRVGWRAFVLRMFTWQVLRNR